MTDLFCTKGSSPPHESGRPARPDLLVFSEGTVYLPHAISPAGRAWIERHCPGAPRFSTALAVEHRVIGNIV